MDAGCKGRGSNVEKPGSAPRPPQPLQQVSALERVMLRVTEDFADLDDVWIEEGTLADRLIDLGSDEDGGFFNLIRNGVVLAVTDYRPPVEDILTPL